VDKGHSNTRAHGRVKSGREREKQILTSNQEVKSNPTIEFTPAKKSIRNRLCADTAERYPL
jgi:hypothetical protein